MEESALHRNANKRSKLNAPLAAAAANDGALPTDVLRDVLLCLPADELCRLRLVCRSWRSLTSDPIFAKAHSSRHNPLVVGLRSNDGRPGHHEVQFLDPSSGRIVKTIPLLRLCEGDQDHHLSTHHCLVYHSEGCRTGITCVINPATGSFTTDHENNSDSMWYTSVFGWVPSTGEYKALRIHHEHVYGLWRRRARSMLPYRQARR
ncbi:hypothetical protein HU200_014174 [Digitaria exilis]|uniref:F-box domain-containing protein n=1 Tax=Digitaria exilis TaxID=1010633 RepID=A0A835KKE6_9POAL|nr:hypothetical protein HU200_014174 [Digitaria exilis]